MIDINFLKRKKILPNVSNLWLSIAYSLQTLADKDLILLQTPKKPAWNRVRETLLVIKMHTINL